MHCVTANNFPTTVAVGFHYTLYLSIVKTLGLVPMYFLPTCYQVVIKWFRTVLPQEIGGK